MLKKFSVTSGNFYQAPFDPKDPPKALPNMNSYSNLKEHGFKGK